MYTHRVFCVYVHSLTYIHTYVCMCVCSQLSPQDIREGSPPPLSRTIHTYIFAYRREASLSLFLCMHTYIHTYMYAAHWHVLACKYDLYIYVYDLYTHILQLDNLEAALAALDHTYIPIYIHTYIHGDIHTHITWPRINTYIHTYIHTHTHTAAGQSRSCSSSARWRLWREAHTRGTYVCMYVCM